MCFPVSHMDSVRVRFQIVLEQLRREIILWGGGVFRDDMLEATSDSSDWGSDDDLADLPTMDDFMN